MNQPQGDKQTGARGQRAIQYTDNKQNHTADDIASAISMSGTESLTQRGFTPGIDTQAYGQHTKGQLRVSIRNLQNQAGPDNHTRDPAQQDKRGKANLQTTFTHMP